MNTDQQNNGLQALLTYDRPTAARLGITPQLLDNTLYDAFGQAEVSTIYTQLNQYYVVMEVAPKYWASPEGLKDTYLIPNSGGGAIPLASVVKYAPSTSPLSVNHTGLFPSVTVSFNLATGVSLGQATQEIQQAQQKLGMPQSLHGQFSGTLEAFQESLGSEPYLILTAILSVYVVLGILYESLIHPHHDSLHAAFGEPGRDARAAAYQNRVGRDVHHRHHSADRHREEERDHDDRLRAECRAHRGQEYAETRSSKPRCCASVRS